MVKWIKNLFKKEPTAEWYEMARERNEAIKKSYSEPRARITRIYPKLSLVVDNTRKRKSTITWREWLEYCKEVNSYFNMKQQA